MNDILEWLRLVLEHRKALAKLPQDVWNKVRELFSKGDKRIGFLKRAGDFDHIYQLSEKSVGKYLRYIVPGEYRAYLVSSVQTSALYRAGKKKAADERREQLGRHGQVAITIYNLYHTNVLGLLFRRIDEWESKHVSPDEITGKASKLLDDLVHNRSFVFVKKEDSFEEIKRKVEGSLRRCGWCIATGSGYENIEKLSRVQLELQDEDEEGLYRFEAFRDKIGVVQQLTILSEIRITVNHQ